MFRLSIETFEGMDSLPTQPRKLFKPLKELKSSNSVGYGGSYIKNKLLSEKYIRSERRM